MKEDEFSKIEEEVEEELKKKISKLLKNQKKTMKWMITLVFALGLTMGMLMGTLFSAGQKIEITNVEAPHQTQMSKQTKQAQWDEYVEKRRMPCFVGDERGDREEETVQRIMGSKGVVEGRRIPPPQILNQVPRATPEEVEALKNMGEFRKARELSYRERKLKELEQERKTRELEQERKHQTVNFTNALVKKKIKTNKIELAEQKINYEKMEKKEDLEEGRLPYGIIPEEAIIKTRESMIKPKTKE